MEFSKDEKIIIRIKDRQGHFLGKIQDTSVYIYCKKCKEFHILENVLKGVVEKRQQETIKRCS